MVMRRFLIQNGKLGVALLVIFSVASLLAFRAGHSEFIASPETAASAPLIKVSTSLGDDVLTLTSMTGKEEISRLFHFELEMLSDRPSIDAKAMLGQSITFSVDLPQGGKRYYNGFVSRFSQAGPLPGTSQSSYQAEVVPWLWFLTRTTDSRIFQNQSVPDIIQQVFSDHGFSDFTPRLERSYPGREYIVQYQESDFDFVSRLMEEEGIFYWFEHEDGKHTMVLGDSAGSYRTDPSAPDIPFAFSGSGESIPGAVTQWTRQYEFRSGRLTQADYDFKKPWTNLLTSASSVIDVPGMENYEIYDYPGGYTDNNTGEQLAKIRIQAEERHYDTAAGDSDNPSLVPGTAFNLTRHPQPDQDGKYLVVSVSHRITSSEVAGTGAGTGTLYENSFTAIPANIVFRPERTTPRPVLNGPQTAFVVGPSGRNVYTDAYGRVKVQFHWDREGKADDRSSCWIRVAQPWGGYGAGALFVPRIGQEVIVDFLEGDPDRPIITGRVYNAKELPLDRSRSVDIR